MVFNFFRRRKSPAEAAANSLYASICAAAREPALFAPDLIPDNVDGRFDAIVLHTHLVLRRLSAAKAPEEFGQALFDTLFADMDQSLREIGISDVVLGKEIKKMAQGFFGRAEAYELGLRGDDNDLAGAVRRNLLATREPEASDGAVMALARYIRRQADHLASQDTSDIIAGKVDFAAPAIDLPATQP
ncbi:ubiquinol-cytochrome C chaperone family protein [Lacibacterium aquatile]|uniref:Ubiquinol-cytochrome C chaperone family protein n=1 Tax=Lacibacterium aquatile TaxID=1168082 RepID=A0ABW5DPM0_9PROT